MKTPIFEVMDGGYLVLECPVCRTQNLHQGQVNVYTRKEDAEEGTHTCVTRHSVHVSRHMGENPSPRRQGLTIEFYCEQCENTAPLPVLGIWQHKGWTEIAWVDEDKWQKWQRNSDD